MINWNLIFSYLTTPLETLSCILSPLVIAINLPWPIIANFKLSVSRISLCWHYQPSFHLTYSLYFCLNSTICQIHQDSKLEEKKIETDKNISLNSQLSHHIFLLHSISPSPYTRLFRAFSFLLKLPTSLTYPVYSAFSYLIKKLKQKLENFHDCLSPNQPTYRLLWPFTLPSFLLLWKNSLAPI